MTLRSHLSTGILRCFVLIFLYFSTSLLLFFSAAEARAGDTASGRLSPYASEFNIRKLYKRYLYLSDNRTVRKYEWLVKKAGKSMSSGRELKSAEESYKYYKNHIIPEVEGKIPSLSLQKKSENTVPLLAKDSYIYIFMSSSVPKSTWKNYIKSIDKLRRSGQDGIGIILRGCIGGCTKVLPTARFIFSLLKHGNSMYKAPILIDPLLFRLFKINRVPVIVYAKHVHEEFSWLSPGVPGNLKNVVDAYKVIGDCGLPFALKELYSLSRDGALLGLYNILTSGWLNGSPSP